MSDELMNTKEVAEYLGVHEKQVYALIKSGKIPCTRVTGKWIFPRALVDKWINENSRGDSSQPDKNSLSTKSLVAAGSNDPILDILLNTVKQEHPEVCIFSCSTGSLEGLRQLKEGLIDIAWCHLFNPQTGSYDLEVLKELIPEKKIAVVHLFFRELGFVYSPDLSSSFSGMQDIQKNGLSFINRQKGSGTRVLIDHILTEEKIEPEKIQGYDKSVYSHIEVGLEILAKRAQVGIATVAIAKLLGLQFTPIIKESFDMVMLQDTFFQAEVQACIDSIQSLDFIDKITPIGDYDFTDTGKIVYTSGQ